MKNIINLKIVLLAAFCLLIFDVSADAQRRRTTGTPKRKTTAAARTATKSAPSVAKTATISAATEKVGNQIKNLTQFIYLLGNSTALIKSVEAEIKSGKVSQSTRNQAEAGRKGFVSAITIFKNAMASLEDEFRANPTLKPYLLQIVGVSEYAATAEQQAVAGQFDQAGRSLILVVNQLTDVLRAMP